MDISKIFNIDGKGSHDKVTIVFRDTLQKLHEDAFEQA